MDDARRAGPARRHGPLPRRLREPPRGLPGHHGTPDGGSCDRAAVRRALPARRRGRPGAAAPPAPGPPRDRAPARRGGRLPRRDAGARVVPRPPGGARGRGGRRRERCALRAEPRALRGGPRGDHARPGLPRRGLRQPRRAPGRRPLRRPHARPRHLPLRRRHAGPLRPRAHRGIRDHASRTLLRGRGLPEPPGRALPRALRRELLPPALPLHGRLRRVRRARARGGGGGRRHAPPRRLLRLGLALLHRPLRRDRGGLGEAGAAVEHLDVASSWGHDSFLLELPAYHEAVARFLGELAAQ